MREEELGLGISVGEEMRPKRERYNGERAMTRKDRRGKDKERDRAQGRDREEERVGEGGRPGRERRESESVGLSVVRGHIFGQIERGNMSYSHVSV